MIQRLKQKLLFPRIYDIIKSPKKLYLIEKLKVPNIDRLLWFIQWGNGNKETAYKIGIDILISLKYIYI